MIEPTLPASQLSCFIGDGPAVRSHGTLLEPGVLQLRSIPESHPWPQLLLTLDVSQCTLVPNPQLFYPCRNPPAPCWLVCKRDPN